MIFVVADIDNEIGLATVTSTGQPLGTSTGDYTALDVNVVSPINTQVTVDAVSIKDPAEETKQVTTTSTGERIALDVNITNDGFDVSFGDKIRYDEFTKDQPLTNGSYVTVYSTTSGNPGKIYTLEMVFRNNDVDIQILVDGEAMVDGLNIRDLADNHYIDASPGGLFQGTVAQVPRFVYVHANSRGIIFEPPAACIFNDQVVVKARAHTNGNRMRRGLIVRAIE